MTSITKKYRSNEGKPPIENFCYFWLKMQGRCQFVRVDIDPILFGSIDALKQHLANHFVLNELPNLYLINDTGKYVQAEELSLLLHNSILFVEPIGMKVDTIFPDFAAAYPDPPIDEKPKKYTIPDNIKTVRTMLENWPNLVHAINKENKKIAPQTDNVSVKSNKSVQKVPLLTTQSLFTNDGGFSKYFLSFAKRLKITVIDHPKFGFPLHSNKEKV